MWNKKIIKLTIFLIIILAAFIPVLSYSLIGFLIIFLILIKEERNIIGYLKANRIFLVLTASIFISSALSTLWYVSLWLALFFAIKIIFSSIVSLYIEERDIERVLFIILSVGIIASILGLFQLIFKTNTIPNSWIDRNLYKIDYRIYATFYNPNIFSGFLNLSIITGITVREYLKDRKIILLGSICSLISSVALLFTYSRGGWISLLLSILTLSIFQRRFLKYGLFLLIAFLIVDVGFSIGRLAPVNLSNDSTIQYRIEIWKATIKIIKDNLIFGIGPGVIWDFIPKYSKEIKTYISHVHNLYLEIFVDTGILGLTIFSFFLKQHLKKMKSWVGDESNIGIINTIAFTFIMSLLYYGFIDAVSLQSQISIYIWLLIGISNNKFSINDKAKESLAYETSN